MSLKHICRSQYINSYRWTLYIVLQVTFLPSHIIAITPVAESPVEEVDFDFLSTINESRLHENDHHVIRIKIASKLASYFVHLSKSNAQFSPEVLSIHEAEVNNYQCSFTGRITSYTGETVGMAALSSCLHENAFEGLIHLRNEHYEITPFTQHKRRRRSNKEPNSKVSIKHKISKPTSTHSKSQRSDARTLSKAELKKARVQMLKDQTSLEDEGYQDDDSEAEHDIDGIDKIPLTLTASTNSSSYKSVLQSANVPRKKRKSKKTPNRVIELAIFTDEAFYNKWKKMQLKDTVEKINQYILALVNNINYLYQQPSLDTTISFRLVNLDIQKSVPSKLKPSKNPDKYLDSFCKFAGKMDKKGAMWDHAMMITGLPMRSESGGENLGIAFQSAMCLRHWSCSLVKYNNGFETTFTAAHELGHSLGMQHDGRGMNKKCSGSKYLMAAHSGTGQINWSDCSNKNIRNFLESGDPRENKKDRSSIPHCLTKRGSKKAGIEYGADGLPGKLFDAAKQCEQVCGKCVPYIKDVAPYNNICKSLHCKKSSGRKIAAHPALEGTACGQENKEMCRNGKCQ